MKKFIFVFALSLAYLCSLIIPTSVFADSPTSTSDTVIENQATYDQDHVLASKIFEAIANNSDFAKDLLNKGFWVPEGGDDSDMVSVDVIKADFESIGLKNVPITTKKQTAPGKIYISKIKDQLSKGVYGFNAKGSLECAATSKSTLSTTIVINGYVHCGIWTNNYNYYGTSNFVTTPNTVSMNSTTPMHVYCSHITNSSTGATWLETGYGKWTSLGSSPVIYTWNGYKSSGQITYKTVSEGTRNITRQEFINSSGSSGTMYVYDPTDNKYILIAISNCGTGRCKCDLNEEEYSPTNQFAFSSVTSSYCDLIENSSGNWVNWDNTISSYIGCAEGLANGHAQGWNAGSYRAVDTWITQ